MKALMTYREWSFDGDTTTQDFMTLKGRTIAMGDFNFKYWKYDTMPTVSK